MKRDQLCLYGWPWVWGDVRWFAARARRILADYRQRGDRPVDVDRLACEFLLRLRCFGPVWREPWRCSCRTTRTRPENLRRWAKRHGDALLREHIVETADDDAFAVGERVHRWVVSWVGWPSRSGSLLLLRHN